ncbi:helix-turn-helix domain-containing protein [Kitasatospora sp. NPDC127111]|uniref:helix-turn-helix domain-containing protein n=1 Tax=Kitasatospora sp. NPDC127111 TaxID=3345363 RepID=UPI003624C856
MSHGGVAGDPGRTGAARARADLAAALKTWRREAGNRSQQAVGERIGIDQTTLSRYENGRQRVPREVVLLLADTYGRPEADRRRALDLWDAAGREDRPESGAARPAAPAGPPGAAPDGVDPVGVDPAEPPAPAGTPAPPGALRRRTAARRSVAAGILGACALAVAALLAANGRAPEEPTDRSVAVDDAQAAPADLADLSALATPSATPAARMPSERPGIEKDTIGPDSRCSQPFRVNATVTWRVCARVQENELSFAVKITNAGRNPVTVKTRVQYARSGTVHPCPGAPALHPLDLAPGRTAVTEQATCTIGRPDAPAAVQAMGWVVAADATEGTYHLSPTAHVYPDHVIWVPDLL